MKHLCGLVALLALGFPAAHAQVKLQLRSPTQTLFVAPATVYVESYAAVWQDGERITSHTLSRDGVQIASGPTGSGSSTAIVTVSNLGSGSYTFRAHAASNLPSSQQVLRTITVTNPPTVQLGAVIGSPYIAPATLGLSANASDSDGTISKVEFYANGTLLATDTAAPYDFSWGSVGAGTYSFTAKAYDNHGVATTSAAQSVTVNPSRVIGNIDGVALDGAGNASVRGWACSTGLNQSIDVHTYLGGGWPSGTHVDSRTANLVSEAAVASACQAGGSAYRFSVPLGNALRDAHGGKGVFVHGISPVGQPNDLISNSGTYTVPALNRNATFVGQSVPTTVLAGQPFSASVQMRNDGGGVWYVTENYRLGSIAGSTWGATRAYPGADVGKGSTATFAIAATAPSTPGTYNFQWQMLQEGVTWFGQASTNVAVRVVSGSISASPNPCAFPEGGSTCDASISWNSTAADAEVWVTDAASPGGRLFASGQNGTRAATGITGTAARFALKAAGVTMATVDVSGTANPPPSITLTSPAAGTRVTPPGTFALAATASDTDGIASVKFYGDGVLLATDTTVPYGFSWTNVASGAHSIYALATDNRGGTKATPTISVLVNAIPTVTLTAPGAGNNGIAPATVAVSANASDTDDGVASVSFYVNGALVAIDTAAPYAHSWSGVAAGNYDVHAVVTDTRGATASTPVTAITIVAPVANPSSSTRYYTYDQHQRLCKVVEPETRATVMQYDAAGNLAWSASGLELLSTAQSAAQCEADRANAEASGRAVRRTYDARNRLQHLRFPDGRGDQDWTYTLTGQPNTITTSNDGPGQALVVNTYDYNRRGLLTGESSGQPNWYSWAVGYGYDRNGSLASQSYPTGATVSYAPNALGQPTQAVAGFGVLASNVQYHPSGSIRQFTYGNGIVHTMRQNARQLPEHVASSGGVLDYTYAFDANGNVGAIYDVARGPSYDRTMTYDGLDRLLTATSPHFGGDGTHRFTYDRLDNLTSWKLAGVKDYAEYYYEPGTHRLMSLRNSMGSTVVGFGYDEQGNLSNKNGQLHKFDYGNRLRTAPAGETYRYDGHGRRVLSRSPQGDLFSYYAQNGQLLYQSDERKPGIDLQEHVYLAGSLIATRHRNHTTGATEVKYQHTDALGSPVAVTNASGAVIERTQYEPYGAIVGGVKKQGVGYTGHVMDAATGLTYMQQRYYDPSVGRFLSVDPVTAYDSGDYRFFNRYAYAFNNPYTFIDPDGRYSCEASVCKAVREGLAAMKASRDTYRKSSAEYKVTDAVIRSIGTKDDGNGPNYKSGSLDGASGAQTDQKGTVTIDMRKVSDSTDMARNMAHEGQHDIDASVNGAANTEETVRATEVNAYSTEAIVANGLGVRLDPVKLGEAVDGSVKKAMDRIKKSEAQ